MSKNKHGAQSAAQSETEAKTTAQAIAEDDAELVKLEAENADRLARIVALKQARSNRTNEYITLLAASCAALPLPDDNGLTATDEAPLKFLLVFKSNGVVEVGQGTKSKAVATKERSGTRDLFALGLKQGDKVCRLIRTDSNAKWGGYDDLNTEVKATVLDSKTLESTNVLGETFKGSLSRTSRHTIGGTFEKNEKGERLYDQENDGMLFWMKDKSSYVLRDGKRLEIDHSTGMVKEAA